MTIGRRPLDKKQQRQRGADVRIALGVPAAVPVVRERILLADEKLGAFAVPIVVADEAAGGEPAGALQAVEIVVQRRLPAAGGRGLRVDRETLRRASRSPRSSLSIVLVRPAADDAAVLDGGVARFERGRADGQPADAGARHAAGAGVAGHVAPGAVGVLRAAPVVGGQLPGFAADFGADALGVVQGEHGELRVAVVAARARDTTRSPCAAPSLIWCLLEPADVAADEQHVLLGLGGGRGPSSAARRCRSCRAAGRGGTSSALRTTGSSAPTPEFKQRQRAQRGDAAVVAGHFVPVAARQLLALEVGDAAIDGGENLGGVDRPARRAAAQAADAGATTATIDNAAERASVHGSVSCGIPSRAPAACSVSSLRFRS